MSRTWLLLPLLLLYVSNLGSVGFGLDPDEPRYASIGREMASSGDWITPHLNGSPWFEKPPLLYWMTAAATKIGLHDEWAARLPVALLSLAFLAFFYAILEREFDARIAMMATAMLGTSAGWIGYSFAGVTDLPVAVMFNAAMLTTLFNVQTRFDTRRHTSAGWIAGVLLGLAVLAKALLPVALFIPIWLIARGKRFAIAAGAILVAGPWHLLVWLRNGSAFWDVYFWQQQAGRFRSAALHHGQPVWFYLPVLLLGLFPWTPLCVLLARRKTYGDVRISSLAIWLAIALVFLSVFSNKLPGYLLSLLPAAAIVLAVALDKAPAREWWVGACVLLLVLAPAIASALPDALMAGFTHTHWAIRFSGWPFVLAAAGAWWLAYRKQIALAVMAAALTTAVGVGYLKAVTLPVLEQRVAARAFWNENASAVNRACIDSGVRPASIFALEYYNDGKLPGCDPGWAGGRVTSSQDGLALVSKTP